MKLILCFIGVLQVSVNRNGADKPLTIGHLLNLLKMTVKKYIKQEDKEEKELNDCLNEILEDEAKYGSGD